MSLPSAWVESLFARLTIRYGSAFMRQYADIDADAVKADWADVLGGFAGQPEAIRYALENLPADKPPNAGQFRLMCNNAPVSAALAITSEVRADPARVADLVASVRPMSANDPKQWARRLQQIELERGGELPDGRRMTRAAREMWRDALGSE
jgi:hypothetical protein